MKKKSTQGGLPTKQKDKYAMVSLRLTAMQRKALGKFAKALDVNTSEFIRAAIDASLEQTLKSLTCYNKTKSNNSKGMHR